MQGEGTWAGQTRSAVKNWEDTADLQQLCPSYTEKPASHLHTSKHTVDKHYTDITAII